MNSPEVERGGAPPSSAPLRCRYCQSDEDVVLDLGRGEAYCRDAYDCFSRYTERLKVGSEPAAI